MPPIADLIGPAGLTAAAIIAVVVLWRDHMKSDSLREETLRSLTNTVATYPASLRDLTSVVLDAQRRSRTRPRNERSTDT